MRVYLHLNMYLVIILIHESISIYLITDCKYVTCITHDVYTNACQSLINHLHTELKFVSYKCRQRVLG